MAWPIVGFLAGTAAALLPGKMPIPLTAGIALLLADMMIVLILAAKPFGARAGVLIAGLLLAFPCFVDASATARCLLVCFAAVPFVAATAFVLVPPVHSLRNRLAYLCGWCGLHRVQRRARGLDTAALMKLIMGTTALAIAVAGVRIASDSNGMLPVRWLAGGIAVFALGEMATAALPLVAAAFGLVVPPLFQSPHMSTSISEFWTQRWNIATSRLLRYCCFAPLSRYGIVWAVSATFVVSGILHMMLAFLLLGTWGISLLCGMFFFIQPVLLFAERRLNVRRRHVALGRVWTLTVLAVTSPLIVEPVLRVVEPGLHEPNTVFHATLAALAFVLVLSLTVSTASLMSRAAVSAED